MTSPLIYSTGGPILTSSPAVWPNSSWVSWEISTNPDLIPHLSNHDPKPLREFGGFFNGPPPAQCLPAPASFLQI